MRFMQDMTQSEIAKRIGVSQMQVSRRLRRALKDLREEAEPAPPAVVALDERDEADGLVGGSPQPALRAA
jgi:DNA-binding Lrp family transcriptional regulator